MPRIKTTNKVQASERFPASPRADGRFQKRIRGILHYFGESGNRVGALAEYERVKNDLYAGRDPRPVVDDESLTLKELANRYISERELEVAAGRLNADWHQQCKKAIDRFGMRVGGSRTIGGLRPDDFADYGRHLSKALGHHAYNRERESIVSMFRHAADSDWIERPVRFGKGFRKIAANVIREARADKLVEPTDLVILLSFLALEHPQLEAMMLLAINAGFGATDCAILKWTHIDVDGAIINLRRQKTHIERKSPLWPETIESLRSLNIAGPFVFRTKHGNNWTAESIAHQLAKQIDRLNAVRGEDAPLDTVMGDFRHTFATYANENGDTDSWKRIMGHALAGLKATYVETIFAPRLRKVVEHVRSRMFTSLGNDRPLT
jgi:integrase